MEEELVCDECGTEFKVKVDGDNIRDYDGCGECGAMLCPGCRKHHTYDDCVNNFIEENDD